MIRYSHAVPLLAAFALGACGSEPEQEPVGEGMSMDDVAARAGEAETPRPGEYRTTQELLEFNVPNMPQQATQMVRSMMEEGGAAQNTYCLTGQETANAREAMITSMTQSDCTVSRFDMSGRTIDAEMQCPSGGGMSGTAMLTGTME